MAEAKNLAQALGGGAPDSSSFDIPVAFLDYQHITKCTNGKELEKILKILRLVK